ncbi:MAG TPA: DUF1501 domain-containing protein [Terriglobia bacterium]|nr:DUF1501 domain-containing protein [Terriglobia bacterium]
MALSRRYFLKSAGLSLFGAGSVPPFLRRTAYALNQPNASARKKVLVAIFQRGAADGLNTIVPFGDRSYYSLRPSIAIPPPSSRSENGGRTVIDLDGFFGLHPSLAGLKPLFDAQHLAIVHAAGSPDSTRSHFDAQDYMETAAPGVRSESNGWLNRYLESTPEAEVTPFRAVAVTPRMPMTLLGAAPALAMNDVKSFRLRPVDPIVGGNGSLAAVFESMYASTSDPLLGRTAREMFEAAATLERLGLADYQPANGARYPMGQLGRSLQQVAQLIRADVGLEVAFAEVSGWDHHVNEGAVEGQLANSLRQFGDALVAFHQDLGDRMSEVLVLSMTEFGRAARENGNRGTDHGHAAVMFALGGPVKGGKVYGRWPGLGEDQLYEGRDLALTTDFRDVFAEVAVRHLRAADVNTIFPGFSVFPSRFRGFLT